LKDKPNNNFINLVFNKSVRLQVIRMSIRNVLCIV